MRVVTVMGLVLAAATIVRPASAQTPNDATNLAILDAANTYDIDASNLAAKRSKNAEVVDLAKRFEHDHSAVRQQDRDLAKKLSITPTPPKDFALTKMHEDAMAKLKASDAAGFDKAYLENEVAYHKAVIDAMKNSLEPAAQHAELKTFITTIEPAFNGHLVAAQTLLDKVNKS